MSCSLAGWSAAGRTGGQPGVHGAGTLHAAGTPRRGASARGVAWAAVAAGLAGLAGRSPAGTRPGGRVRSGLISGPRWRRPHAARRRLGLARRAVRYAARHRRPERLASTLRPRGPRSPRGTLETGGPRGSRGARRAHVAGHVDQAARRVHARRVQHASPLTTRPRGRRRTMPVTGGLAAARSPKPPKALAPPALGDRENQQRNQADHETRYTQSHAQAGHMEAGAAARQVGSRARDRENPARQDHHGADHRQGNDKPHPPGRDGI